MKGQNRGAHLVTPAGTMTGLKACTACVCICVHVYVCQLVWSRIGKFQTQSIPSPFHWKLLIKMSSCSPMLLWTGFWPSHKYANTHTHFNPWLWVWEWHQCLPWGPQRTQKKVWQNNRRVLWLLSSSPKEEICFPCFHLFGSCSEPAFIKAKQIGNHTWT